jgi:hypothetical protein
MDPDQELMLIFGGLHLVSLLLGGVLFLMFLRSDTTRSWDSGEGDDEDGGGGGGNDRVQHGPKPRPSGGIPLPDAQPADVRLRGHETLREARPGRDRRPSREPVPHRVPDRHRVPAGD